MFLKEASRAHYDLHLFDQKTVIIITINIENNNFLGFKAEFPAAITPVFSVTWSEYVYLLLKKHLLLLSVMKTKCFSGNLDTFYL